MTQSQFDRFISGHSDLSYGISNDKSYIKFISTLTKQATLIDMKDFSKMNHYDLFRAIYKGHLVEV